MRKNLILVFIFLGSKLFAQDSSNYHQVSVGINVLNLVFKNAELNAEFMLNKHLGLTCDLGYQFNTNAGNNLNLVHNTMQGYYGKIGPRLYFAPHNAKGNGYISGGFIYSYFKQKASLSERDFYEETRIGLATQQKLEGNYFGIGTLIQVAKNIKLDFGTSFNFFSPKSIEFPQDYSNINNAQPGFGNFIFRSSSNFGMGIGLNCSVKYEFVHSKKRA